MKKYLYQSEWLGLDQELREKLKNVFDINRSEGMKVVNNRLVSDGCSQGDLIAGITIGKMIEYLDDTSFGMNTDNSEKIFDELFERILNKVKEKNETNNTAKTEDKRVKIESERDKQTAGSGDDRPSGDDSINAGSGDRQDIQRSKAKDKGKRAKHTSRKRAVKKAN